MKLVEGDILQILYFSRLASLFYFVVVCFAFPFLVRFPLKKKKKKQMKRKKQFYHVYIIHNVETRRYTEW